MNTTSIILPLTRQAVKPQVPTTSRGRALYTTAWFMHGKPRAVNDNKLVKTTQGALPC